MTFFFGPFISPSTSSYFNKSRVFPERPRCSFPGAPRRGAASGDAQLVSASFGRKLWRPIGASNWLRDHLPLTKFAVGGKKKTEHVTRVARRLTRLASSSTRHTLHNSPPSCHRHRFQNWKFVEFCRFLNFIGTHGRVTNLKFQNSGNRYLSAYLKLSSYLKPRSKFSIDLILT